MRRLLSLLVVLLISGQALFSQINPGDNMHGFKLIEKRFVKEVDSDCFLFTHEASGARLFKIANDDNNKTFCISFKTITESDAGTPHILEHSVLNGSKNFPVKSPFDILAKGSLNTFLNAMTGSDITLYPVCSMNDKDFRTLMHIYLDAVFKPLIYDDPRILDQEGWHHELEHPDSSVSYKGVVYNEMKGAFSSPTREWGYLVDQQLFPDTPYRFSSGGYPSEIPTLTHEAFLDFHRKYYHPSNSYIFLYGDGELSSELEFINANYLSHYSDTDQIIDMPLQAPFEALKVGSGVYSATEGGSLEGESYLSLSFVCGESKDRELVMGLRVLAQALFNNESAPVRLALQEAGIGKDIGAWIDDLRQNVFHIRVQNANPDEADAFKAIVLESLNQVYTDGLDTKSVTGIINRMEFQLREGNNPQRGLTYNGQSLGSWFWTDEPFSGLEYEKPLAATKAKIQAGELRDLISRYFLNNSHALLFTLNPKPGLEGENDLHTANELAAYKKGLSTEQTQELVVHTDMLVDYQKTEDSPEALASIPLLDLADIEPKIDWYQAQEHKLFWSKTPYLLYNAFTNNISYMRFFFDLRVLNEEQLPYASLLATLLGSLSTESYTFGELDNALDTHLGGFNTYLTSYLEDQDDAKLRPKFVLSTKVLSANQTKAFEFSEEVLKHSLLTDSDRLKKILVRHQSRLASSVKRDGRGYARSRLFSYTSRSGMFDEITGGLDYYWFVTNLVDNFDSLEPSLIQELEAVSSLLFTKNNLLASVTCAESDLKIFKKNLSKFSRNLGQSEPLYQNWVLKSVNKNEGIMAASKVQYVLQGSNFKDLGYEWNGKIRVLNQIISREWLKNQVRVIGGAYGGYAQFSSSGLFYFGSYRDPNLTETLENYKNTPQFLNSYAIDELEMSRFIIGTISRMDRPRTPAQKGNIAVNRFLSKTTRDQLQLERDQVLSTTLQDVKSYEKMISDILAASPICVYGNEDKLKQNEVIFSKLITID